MPRKNHENIDNQDDFQWGTGEHSGQDKMFDRLNYEDEHETSDDEEDDLLDDEDLQEPQKPQKKGIANIKPKLIGKHSLAHDNIFKGKKTKAVDDNEMIEDSIIKQASGSFEFDSDGLAHEESRNNIDYHRDLRLQQEIYNCLKNNTDLKFQTSRRKPSQYDLNNYFKILLTDLAQFGYSYTEIFVELSQYFSDNTWSIFTLLENRYKEIIIKELSDKFGLKEMNKIDFV